MHNSPFKALLIFLLVAALLLSACQVPLLPYLPVPLADENTVDQTTDQTTDHADSNAEAQSGRETSEADVPSETADSTAENTAEEIPENRVEDDDTPTATIIVSSLRMRAGPGVAYDVVGAAQAGEQLPLQGQAYDCQWLNVDHPAQGSVWLSGAPQYTTINVSCEQVPAVEPPAVPTAVPVEETAGESEPAPTAAPPAEAAPPAASSQDAEEPMLPTDQGCYLFQNFVGPELNVTITAMNWQWNENFRVPEGGEMLYCFAPGRYAITIDAPPPWSDMNTEVHVQAGQHFLFPVEGRK